VSRVGVCLEKGARRLENFKSGFVSIIGRTNVGKSTLINALVGEKVAAVVNKSQTTRTAIRAIVNRENSQIIFIDTPGIHKPKTKLGETMLETAYKSSEEVDVILFLVDSTNNKEISKGDKIIIEKLKERKVPVILVLNKIDLVKKESLLETIEMYRNAFDFKAVIPISALNSNNNRDLSVICDEIEKYLPEGPKFYDEDEYTDQTSRQLVEEIIREKALRLLNEEVPHGIFVETEKMELSTTTKGEEIYNIDATIYCLRDGHKGIIIGKKGAMLKRIASSARIDMEKMLQTKVNLSVWVKVREDWLNKDNFVKKFKLE